MKKLYLQTGEMPLSAGEHILSAPKDSPFLPDVIINGDFTCRDGMSLAPGRNHPVGAPFYGEGTLVFRRSGEKPLRRMFMTFPGNLPESARNSVLPCARPQPRCSESSPTPESYGE